jgi:phospholipid N-methyltransferase
MFSSEFYPTPKPVIEKMLEPYASRYGYALSGKTILEPSAGKGDILDFISDSGVRKNKLYACEINQDLQFILQEKSYKVINTDFLTYQGDYHFDLIIGNPP